MTWHLDETVDTSVGTVRAGRCGQGPNIILAHGWPWSSFSWHRIIPALADHYTVHWFDMIGYGQSEMSARQRSSLDVQGRLFTEMMAHWQVSKPSVVAHDFGGATTLRAHLLHGCEFSSYVLMNVVAVRPWGSEFFEHVGRHVDAFTGLPPHIHEAVVRAYIQGALVNPIDADDMEALVSPWLSDAGRGSFYRQFAQADEVYTTEIEPTFDKLRCDVDIIWGEDDPWIPLSRGRELQDMITGSTLATLTGVGHLPQLEAPDRLVPILLERLSK